jgi:hypothetical protein
MMRAQARRGGLSPRAATSQKCLFHAGFLQIEKFSRDLRRRASSAARTLSSTHDPSLRTGVDKQKNHFAGFGQKKRVGLVTRPDRANQWPNDSGRAAPMPSL